MCAMMRKKNENDRVGRDHAGRVHVTFPTNMADATMSNLRAALFAKRDEWIDEAQARKAADKKRDAAMVLRLETYLADPSVWHSDSDGFGASLDIPPYLMEGVTFNILDEVRRHYGHGIKFDYKNASGVTRVTVDLSPVPGDPTTQ